RQFTRGNTACDTVACDTVACDTVACDTVACDTVACDTVACDTVACDNHVDGYDVGSGARVADSRPGQRSARRRRGHLGHFELRQGHHEGHDEVQQGGLLVEAREDLGLRSRGSEEVP